MRYKLLSLLYKVPLLSIIPRYAASIKTSPIKAPARVLGCGGKPPKYKHAVFNCSKKWEKVQEPIPAQFDAETFLSKDKDSNGKVIQINELVIARYWKSVISVPTACNNTGQISKTTAVEKAKQYSAEISSEIGKASVAISLKKTDTLGFVINIGQAGYETKNELFQRWTYVKLKQRKTGLMAGLAWWLWGGGSSCQEDQQPEDNFGMFVCRHKCQTQLKGNGGKKEVDKIF